MAITAFRNCDSRGRRSRGGEANIARIFEEDFYTTSCHLLIMRMIWKRQVFRRIELEISTDTRLTHTMSVIRIARKLASGLHLNEELAGTIALAHDVAHCPYGHLGETILNEHLPSFVPRYDHSSVAPYVLNWVADLDLTYEVLEGILWHGFDTGVLEAQVPAEYRLVAIADKIAYVLGDSRDAVIVVLRDLYKQLTTMDHDEAWELCRDLSLARDKLGSSYEERLSNLMNAVIRESVEAGEVRFANSAEFEIFSKLRHTLSSRLHPRTDLPEDIDRLHNVLGILETADIEEDPYLLFALMTDDELRETDEMGWWGLLQERFGPPHIIELMKPHPRTGQVALKLPPRDQFAYLAADLSLATR
jgi:dGTPase